MCNTPAEEALMDLEVWIFEFPEGKGVVYAINDTEALTYAKAMLEKHHRDWSIVSIVGRVDRDFGKGALFVAHADK